MRHGLALLPLLLVLVACAGSESDPNAPPPPDDTSAWAARFPEHRWITGWGVSGTSRREAEQDARAQVAAKVRSSITAETTALARAVMRDEEVTDFQELVSEVRTSTTFTHAEMIRIVEATAHTIAGERRVLAVLNRQDLAHTLQSDYEEAVVDWRPAADALALADDLPTWTAAWQRFRGGFAGVIATAAETRAATGLDPAGFRADRTRWRAGHAARDSVLQATEIVLVLAPVPDLDPAELAERLSAGFTHLGVAAGSGRCRPNALALRLEPVLRSRQVIGRVVSLELRGTLGPCDAGEVWTEVVISGAALRGDGREPEADLLRSMTPDAVAPLLAESLGHVVPF